MYIVVILRVIVLSAFQLALCHQAMRELSNPGASGSLFYLSADDEFIIKTVQRKEAKFLQKLLPGYYLVRLKKALYQPYYMSDLDLLQKMYDQSGLA